MQLMAVGGRVTPLRIETIRLLRAVTAALTHAEIEERLRQQGLEHIDRVTLYRVLEWAIGVNLVHKVADAHGVFRFVAVAAEEQHADHAHFRCTGCGTVVCLDEPTPQPPALPDGFQVSSMHLDIQGECAGCAAPHKS